MTDETTARDRAAEDLARRIESQALISDRPGQLDELEQIAREVRALAGAPTADVAEEVQRLRTEVSLLRMELTALRSGSSSTPVQSGRCWHAACVRTIAHSVHETDMGERWHERRPASPEGVDAADQLRFALAAHERVTKRADETYEAARQYEAELTAAQAAIQRVREKHNRYADGSCWECGKDHPCPSVRALDGDTTEEA